MKKTLILVGLLLAGQAQAEKACERELLDHAEQRLATTYGVDLGSSTVVLEDVATVSDVYELKEKEKSLAYVAVARRSSLGENNTFHHATQRSMIEFSKKNCKIETWIVLENTFYVN